jgi:hypothetical protein
VSGPRTAVCGGTLATDYGVFAADLLIGHLASLGLPMRVVAGLAAEGAGVLA